MPHRFITRFLPLRSPSRAPRSHRRLVPTKANEKLRQRMYDGFNKRNEIVTGTPYNAMLEPAPM